MNVNNARPSAVAVLVCATIALMVAAHLCDQDLLVVVQLLAAVAASQR